MLCLRCLHRPPLLPRAATSPRSPRHAAPRNSSSSSSSSSTRRSLVTLAIETSCDDTGVAVLSRSRRTGKTSLLFNERISSDNRAYRGIQPAVTVIGHSANLAPLVRRALDSIPEKEGLGAAGGEQRRVPDFVSVTRGPGIAQSLATGLSTAKGLAVAWGVPLVGVHHMQAHALTPRLAMACGMPMSGAPATMTTKTTTTTTTDSSSSSSSSSNDAGPEFPFLSLLVSGGHTQLVHSASLTDHRVVINTVDSAVGNVLDQAARVILPPEVLDASEDVMYGRLLEAFAFPEDKGSDGGGDKYAFFKPALSRADEMVDHVSPRYGWAVPLPFRQSRKLAYSFTSIHTNAHRIAAANPGGMDVAERRELARHVLSAAFRHLVSRICIALEDDAKDDAKGGEGRQRSGLADARTLVVAGGVASNRFLMHVLRSTLDARGHGHLDVVAPPPALCTDNAAMIAWAGMEMYEAGWHTDLSVLPVARWPMDPSQDGGIMGMDGWLRRD